MVKQIKKRSKENPIIIQVQLEIPITIHMGPINLELLITKPIHMVFHLKKRMKVDPKIHFQD